MTTDDDGDIELELIRLLAEGLNREPSTIRPTDRLKDYAAIDSLETVEIAMAIEDGFGIEVPEEELFQAETVQDLIDIVRKYRR